MKKLFLTLLMISGLTLSAQDENAKNWMVGAILPLPNTTSIYTYRAVGSDEIIKKSFPLGFTTGYKGFVASFYATRAVFWSLSKTSTGTSNDGPIRLDSEDFWERSYSFGYQYTFGKAYDVPFKPVLGGHAIFHKGTTDLDFEFVFDFGIRYKSMAFLASAFQRRDPLTFDRPIFPLINVKNRDTFWSIKAQYYF